MLDLTTVKKSVLVFSVINAFFTGLIADYFFANKLDYWIHDSAIVFQHRTQWNHSGIVVLDDDVPFNVGRKQALPLFARATERLIEAGAKGVFLDARVSKDIEGRMPYAQCIKSDGMVQWSMPDCSQSANQQCQINHSELGDAPLKMHADAINNFLIAPYLDAQNNLPSFLLFGVEASFNKELDELVVSDRLVTFDSPIARWVDLSEDHAVSKLIEFSQAEKKIRLYQRQPSDELCNAKHPCRRIRLSLPKYYVEQGGEQKILPVSQLASCDVATALQTASLLKDKVVVLQTTAPDESTDLVVTPMTTALFGPKLMTPGAQYIIDEIETIINQDSPQPPPYIVKVLLFAGVAVLSVMAGMLLQQALLWIFGGLIFIALCLLCVLNPIVQLWPVVATMLAFLMGAGQIVFIHLIVGYKEGTLARKYLPTQVHRMLMTLRKNESFVSRRCHVAVLMSDLAGYTTVTGLLKEPYLVLELMNDYLEETSYVLQKIYDGILEAYVGDMVCYYWAEDKEKDRGQMYKKVLLGAIELRELQRYFFITLQKRYKNKIDTQSLQRINSIIDAGIGITAGNVVMGDLGPKHGIKKFGILGDPLNLAARIESLTRLFNTDIIIVEDFLEAAQLSGLVVRKLGSIKVKGRVLPETLYALGCSDEKRFDKNNVEKWTLWLDGVESGVDTQRICPDCYQKDMSTVNDWLSRNLLGSDGVWYLDEK